jgi:hypothetical protein
VDDHPALAYATSAVRPAQRNEAANAELIRRHLQPVATIMTAPPPPALAEEVARRRDRNVRDIVVARSADRGATWSEPVRVHADDWKFDACPHAGPAIATDDRGRLHVTWWTGKEGSAGVYYAQSTDGGKTFGQATPLGVAQFSRPAHVQLGLARGDRVIVAWDDGTRQVPRVVVRVSPDGGAYFAAGTLVSASGRAASFPVLGVSRDSLAIAWSEMSADQANAAAAKAASRDRTAPKGLEAVGDAQVFVRRGVVQ